MKATPQQKHHLFERFFRNLVEELLNFNIFLLFSYMFLSLKMWTQKSRKKAPQISFLLFYEGQASQRTDISKGRSFTS